MVELTSFELEALGSFVSSFRDGAPSDTAIAAEHAMAKLRSADRLTRPSWEDLNRVAEIAVGKTLNWTFERNIGHEVFRVPNNFIGRAVRWLLSRYLNKQVYKFRAVGRRPATKGLRSVYRYGTPLSLSKEIAIYIDVKRGHSK